MKSHLYSATISNLSVENRTRLMDRIPLKYFFFHLNSISCNSGVTAPRTLWDLIPDSCVQNDAGSGAIFFRMNHKSADALRKWLWRRYKGRCKFARQFTEQMVTDNTI